MLSIISILKRTRERDLCFEKMDPEHAPKKYIKTEKNEKAKITNNFVTFRSVSFHIEKSFPLLLVLGGAL